MQTRNPISTATGTRGGLIRRRELLAVGAGALSVPALRPASAQGDFPSRPLRLIVPFAPGGNIDVFGRLVAARLGPELGQNVVVENRPGANAILGTQATVQAPVDGYTLLVMGTAHYTLNPLLYRRLPYDSARDLLVLAILADTPLVAVVNPSLPVRSMQELATYARERPDQLNFGSAGNGNTTHLAVELFRAAAGIDMTHVPFNGSAPGLLALTSGEIQLMFDPVTSSLPLVRDGRLRALGVTTEARIAALPAVPTIAESGYPGYVATTWSGIAIHQQVPMPVAERLRAALNAVHADPEVRARIEALGLLSQPPRDAAAINRLLVAERERWSAIITARGIHLD